MQEKTKEGLEAEVKRLTKELEFAQLKVMALNTMIDIAEEHGIQIRKKIWGQTIERICKQQALSIAAICRLFGHGQTGPQERLWKGYQPPMSTDLG